MAFCSAFASLAADDSLRPIEIDGLTRVGIGMTRDNKTMSAHIPRDWLSAKGDKIRVLFIAGAESEHGLRIADENVVAALKWFQGLKKRDDLLGFDPEKFSLAAIPADFLEKGPWPSSGYPPSERYDSKTESIQAYLWTWIGMAAPDLVVDVIHVGLEKPRIYIPDDYEPLGALKKNAGDANVILWHEKDLARQLSEGSPAGMGSVPALHLQIGRGKGAESCRDLLKLLTTAKFHGPSPARAEKIRRQDRSPQQFIGDLLPHYGQKLNEIAYIPVMPLLARLDLADQTGQGSHREHVEKVAAEFLSGKKTPAIKSGSEMAGFLLFAELARRSEGEKKEAFIKLVRSAADLCFDEKDNPRELPPFHNEMSDAVFMSGPILAAAGRLTAEQKYYDACLRHTENMLKLVVREDGLCRHSPLCEAAWGRGNGFVALGLSLILDNFPAEHPGRKRLEDAFVRHLRALAKHQDPDGTWHQVIDEPGSYRELSATCMISFAIYHAIRRGNLPAEEFCQVADRAWPAILARCGPNGQLVDVCIGTGKQKTLRDYFDRPAIFGPDLRGGGMALLIAVEKAWQLPNCRMPPP